MTQFLDKSGLEYYTTKLKEYISAQTTAGISKTEADKIYVAKTDWVPATDNKNGLMSSTDKEALNSIIKSTKENVPGLGETTVYSVKDDAVSTDYYNVATFAGFVTVAESSITTGSTTGGTTVFNTTTKTFCTKKDSTYYANVVDNRRYGTLGTKGFSPEKYRMYVDTTTGIVYISTDGANLTALTTFVQNSEIDTMFA